jgi:hypothetical protein
MSASASLKLITELGMPVAKILNLFLAETIKTVITLATVTLIILELQVQCTTRRKDKNDDRCYKVDCVALAEIGCVLR